MPYKKGPKNTLRYYSSSTGRYENAPFSEALRMLEQKHKKTKEEKDAIQKEMLFNKANHSKDRYLLDVFLYLEKNCPNCVKMVNEKLYHKSIHKTREVDIVTKNAIIEIKSGRVRRRTTQLLRQKDLSKEYKKKHVVYAPDITDKKCNELRNKGIDVVRTKHELLERVKKWKI